MSFKRYTKTIVATVAALGAAAAMLTVPNSASAASGPVIPCPIIPLVTPATDFIKLPGIGVDVGANGMNGDDPACSATLRWDISGNTITPDFDGELYLKNSLGVSARVQLKYYTVHNTLLNTINGALKLGTTSGVDTFPIHIDGYSSPLVYRVDVSSQVLAGGIWTNVGTQIAYLSSSTKSPDSVTISTSAGLDVGTAIANGVPTAPATLTWELAGNTTTARLNGNLYFLNSLGVKAHVRLKTFDVHGALLQSTASTTREALSNNLETFAVNLPSNPNPLIYKAEVSIEVLVGATWTQVGSTVTAFI